MAGTSNVIEVDFRARRGEVDEVDDLRVWARALVEDDPVRGADGLLDMARNFGRDRDEWRRAWYGAMRYARRLERELRVHQYARFSFTEEEVFSAMPAGHVRAGEVAAIMFPGSDVPHGILVRIGRSFAQLEKQGRVRRVRGDCYGFEWQAVNA